MASTNSTPKRSSAGRLTAAVNQHDTARNLLDILDMHSLVCRPPEQRSILCGTDIAFDEQAIGYS
jgi:hypothetical protein